MESVPVAPDASPLVVLAKLECIGLLTKLYGKVVVTPGVWDEVITKGKTMGARDAAYLEKFFIENRCDRAMLTVGETGLVQRLRDETGIGQGEAEVLAVAKTRNLLAILDDKGARASAFGLGVAHTGTAGLLFEAFLHRFLSYLELVELLEQLGKVAWISPELLAGILRRAREVESK